MSKRQPFQRKPLPKLPGEPVFDAAGDGGVDPDEVGDFYSLTIERHKDKPKLWRLRERQVVKGELFENVTDWQPFERFTPALGMAHGRYQRFCLPQFGKRIPMLVRRG